MKFLIYETTNLVNGKKYRGAHIANSLQDEYLGSGKLLKKSIAKYGIENFHRIILKECSSVEELFQYESAYVNAEWVERTDTYNLKIGGEGGWDYINKQGLRWNDEKKKLHSIEMKKKRISGEWGPKKPTYGFKNKKHSTQTKNKISKNNGNRLSKEEVEKRLSDCNLFPDERGKITKLAKLWNISHTQVRRFLSNYLKST
jgi:hypothetical protein